MTFGQQNTEKESHDMLSYAFDHGINILDTAEAVSVQRLSLSVLLVVLSLLESKENTIHIMWIDHREGGKKRPFCEDFYLRF